MSRNKIVAKNTSREYHSDKGLFFSDTEKPKNNYVQQRNKINMIAEVKTENYNSWVKVLNLNVVLIFLFLLAPPQYIIKCN